MYKTLTTGIAVLALAGTGAAFAGSAAQVSPSAAQASRQAGHHDRMANHLAKLKGELKITSAQESAWSGFAMALHNMRPSAPRHMTKTQSGGLTPAPDLFNAMAQMARDRADHAQALAQAADTLYQKLTPTQRAVWNTHLADLRGRMHRHHWHRHGKHLAPHKMNGATGGKG